MLRTSTGIHVLVRTRVGKTRARCIREIIGRGLGKKNTDCVSVEMMISQDT